MPSPSKNIQMNPRTRNQGGGLQKRKTEVGGTLVSDLGEDPHVTYTPQAPLEAGSASDDIREQPPAVTVEPVSDTAQIMALVTASVRAQPALAHQLSRVKVAKDRTTVHFDTETAGRLRSYCLANEMTMSSLLARALPWIKANANETALRWAQQEVKARRQVTLRQRAAAATGSVELPPGAESVALYFTLKAFGDCKSLWSKTGLTKKGFLEAALYLFLEIRAPKA